MKHGFYIRLAANGIQKNKKTYVPYLLTCTGMILISYLLFFLMKSNHISAMRGGGTLQEMLLLGGEVFSIFSVIFLFYTNSFLIRRRKQEFGLYNILGMGKGNIARILVWESILMALISFTGGLVLGILCSKAAELAIAWVLEGEISFAYSVEGWALWRTIGLFVVIFALILLNSLRQIRVANPIELLHSTSAGEKPPKGNWFLAVAGVVILAAAYVIAVSIQDPIAALNWFFIAVLMVIVATYLLFIAGSVVLCRILKKKKDYYYQSNHFISVSTMMYRMKHNGAGLASICVLSTIVLVMVSSGVCLYAGKGNALQQAYPREINMDVKLVEDETEHTDENMINERLQSCLDEIHTIAMQETQTAGLSMQNLIQYRSISMAIFLEQAQVSMKAATDGMANTIGGTDTGTSVRSLTVVPLEDYNRLTGEQELLEADEILICCAGNRTYGYDTLTLADLGTLRIKREVSEFMPGRDSTYAVTSTIFIVVPDMELLGEIDSYQKQVYQENASLVEAYYGFDVNGSEEEQRSLAEAIIAGIQAQDPDAGTLVNTMVGVRSIAAERGDFYGIYGGLFVVGIVLSGVFVLATVLIMYYKQITEGYEDRARFEVMQKVGMTKREIRRSIHSQILTVFFAPLGMAGLHLMFAFPILYKILMLFRLQNRSFLIAVTACCFLVFVIFYVAVYLITSRVYYRIVSEEREV